MKTRRLFTLASLLCLALTSCVKDEYSIEVTTEDATISSSQNNGQGTSINTRVINFTAIFEWKKSCHRPQGFGAVYYGKTSNLTAENHLGSSGLDELGDGTTIYISRAEFNDINVYTKGEGNAAQIFLPGDTMYYRAYAKVNTDAGEIFYIYGKEKFAVIPKE